MRGLALSKGPRRAAFFWQLAFVCWLLLVVAGGGTFLGPTQSMASGSAQGAISIAGESKPLVVYAAPEAKDFLQSNVGASIAMAGAAITGLLLLIQAVALFSVDGARAAGASAFGLAGVAVSLGVALWVLFPGGAYFLALPTVGLVGAGASPLLAWRSIDWEGRRTTRSVRPLREKVGRVVVLLETIRGLPRYSPPLPFAIDFWTDVERLMGEAEKLRGSIESATADDMAGLAMSIEACLDRARAKVGDVGSTVHNGIREKAEQMRAGLGAVFTRLESPEPSLSEEYRGLLNHIDQIAEEADSANSLLNSPEPGTVQTAINSLKQLAGSGDELENQVRRNTALWGRLLVTGTLADLEGIIIETADLAELLVRLGGELSHDARSAADTAIQELSTQATQARSRQQGYRRRLENLREVDSESTQALLSEVTAEVAAAHRLAAETAIPLARKLVGEAWRALRPSLVTVRQAADLLIAEENGPVRPGDFAMTPLKERLSLYQEAVERADRALLGTEDSIHGWREAASALSGKLGGTGALVESLGRCAEELERRVSASLAAALESVPGLSMELEHSGQRVERSADQVCDALLHFLEDQGRLEGFSAQALAAYARLSRV